MEHKVAQCIFEQAQTPCMILAETLPTTVRDKKGFGSTNKGYNKTNKAEAIACAIRVAVETQTNIQAQSLSNNDDDRYSEFMRASQEAPPDPELENKHKTKLDKLHRAESQVDTHKDPPLLPQDRVNSSVPQHVTMNKDFIIQATGYHKSDFLLKHFKTMH